jgi:hypothetical protein
MQDEVKELESRNHGCILGIQDTMVASWAFRTQEYQTKFSCHLLPPFIFSASSTFLLFFVQAIIKKNVFVPNPHGDGCGTRKWAESTRLTSPWSNASRYGLFHLDHPSHPCDRRPLLVSVVVDTEPRRTRRRARSQPIAAGEARIRGWRARDRVAAGGRTERSPS